MTLPICSVICSVRGSQLADRLSFRSRNLCGMSHGRWDLLGRLAGSEGRQDLILAVDNMMQLFGETSAGCSGCRPKGEGRCPEEQAVIDKQTFIIGCLWVT